LQAYAPVAMHCMMLTFSVLGMGITLAVFHASY
jgi:hypothetical protein